MGSVKNKYPLDPINAFLSLDGVTTLNMEFALAPRDGSNTIRIAGVAAGFRNRRDGEIVVIGEMTMDPHSTVTIEWRSPKEGLKLPQSFRLTLHAMLCRDLR